MIWTPHSAKHLVSWWHLLPNTAVKPGFHCPRQTSHQSWRATGLGGHHHPPVPFPCWRGGAAIPAAPDLVVELICGTFFLFCSPFPRKCQVCVEWEGSAFPSAGAQLSPVLPTSAWGEDLKRSKDLESTTVRAGHRSSNSSSLIGRETYGPEISPAGLLHVQPLGHTIHASNTPPWGRMLLQVQPSVLSPCWHRNTLSN